MTNSEYEQILSDVAVGKKKINYQPSGAKNLFLRISPRMFKEQTGCSVHLSCFVTRLVVFVLDPCLVITSTVAGFYWLGVAGVFLCLPSIFLWGWTKYFYSLQLPTGFTVLFVTLGISMIGHTYFGSLSATIYFICLALQIFFNYLLYAVPLSEAMKCVPNSKIAFEIFHEISKNTPLLPVFTITELNEYLDEETKTQIMKN